MPYPSEHAARIHDPGKYARIRRENDKFGEGIDVIWGVPKGGGATEVQAIRFDASKFSVEAAKRWLRNHDYKPMSFEAATEKPKGKEHGQHCASCSKSACEHGHCEKCGMCKEAAPDGVPRRQIGTIDAGAGPMRVMVVDGNAVKVEHDMDFVEGGNSARYDFVPAGEVWVDAALSPQEWEPVAQHEAYELKLMQSGTPYEQAHEQANKIEKSARMRLAGFQGGKSCEDCAAHSHCATCGKCEHKSRASCDKCGYEAPEVKGKALCHKTVAIERLAAPPDAPGGGYIEGYAAVFGNVDSQGDVIRRGAFAKTIRESVPAGKIKLMVQHAAHGGGTMEVIGVVTEAKEDEKGLWIHAALSSDPTAQEARTKAREGVVTGLSIGYRPIKQNAVTIGGKQVNELVEVQLIEVTLTPFPANDLAEITSAKGAQGPEPTPETDRAATQAVSQGAVELARRRLALARAVLESGDGLERTSG